MLASTAAQAQYTFEYGGRTIRIDPDRGTVSIPGVYDNTGRKARSARNEDGDRDRPQQTVATAGQDRSADRTRAAPAARQRRSRHKRLRRRRPPRRSLPRRRRAVDHDRAVAPADTATAAACSGDIAGYQHAASASAARLPPSPPCRPHQPPRTCPGGVQASNSPLGVWLTEEKEGKVRIEQCGANLCGYSVDKKSNQNGEQVLINMKPGKDQMERPDSRSEHRQHL